MKGKTMSKKKDIKEETPAEMTEGTPAGDETENASAETEAAAETEENPAEKAIAEANADRKSVV